MGFSLLTPLPCSQGGWLIYSGIPQVAALAAGALARQGPVLQPERSPPGPPHNSLHIYVTAQEADENLRITRVSYTNYAGGVTAPRARKLQKYSFLPGGFPALRRAA